MEWLNKLRKNKNLPLMAGGLILGLALIAFGGGNAHKPVEEPSLSATEDLHQIAGQLEEEITALLLEIPGVNRLKVMVYLECSGEEVFSAGEELPVKHNNARLQGIGVVCPGVGDELALNITRLLSALFGLASNKIYVTG
jgi:hypothetical protein